MLLARHQIFLGVVPYEASFLELGEMTGERLRRDLGGRLDFRKGIRVILHGTKHLYPPRVGKGRGKCEERFSRLGSATKREPKGCENLAASASGTGGRWTVFDPKPHPPAGQQPARFQCAQVLTGGRHRQLHLPRQRRDRLTGLPDQPSQDLEAFTVCQDTAGAPKRGLNSRRHGQRHTHILCKV